MESICLVCLQYGNDLLLSGVLVCLKESARLLVDMGPSMVQWYWSCDEKGNLTDEIPIFSYFGNFSLAG